MGPFPLAATLQLENMTNSSSVADRLTRFGCDFFEFFSLVLADTPALMDEAFRLRYQVYCKEMGFEKPEDCPGGLEQDEFDRRSVNVLLKHKESGRFVGCVRLIVVDPADISRPFPFEIVAIEQIASRSAVFQNTPREKFGEISRLSVISEFRRRRSDGELGLYSVQELISNSSGDIRRNNIPPALGLVFSAACLGLDLGLEAVFVMMELRLARMLRGLGLEFRQVAEPIEYHGPRAPFEITRESLLGEMSLPLEAALSAVRVHTGQLSQAAQAFMNARRPLPI